MFLSLARHLIDPGVRSGTRSTARLKLLATPNIEAFRNSVIGPRLVLSGRPASRNFLVAGAVAIAAVLLFAGRMGAAEPEDEPPVVLTPQSPQVREAVRQAATYLANLSPEAEKRAGGKALIALALLKSGAVSEHPKMTEAVEAIRQELRETSESSRPTRDLIYSTGVSIVFLTALDPEGYRREIEALLQNLFAMQKPHGGWGYAQQQTGDTSMTQYAVLALWEASQAGFRVPLNVWIAVAQWLLATQDPSGAFGYQGVMAEGDERVSQSQIRITLAAAGTGSLYICASYLKPDPSIAEIGPAIPPQFKPVAAPNKPKTLLKKSGSRTIDARKFMQALQDGDSWLDENFTARPNLYPYYFCYTFERYAAFREFVGAESTVRPTWYSEIASELIRRQRDGGAWSAANPIGNPVATAFAVLFLTRSTQQTLKERRYAGGTLIGGRGLPADVSDVEVRRGRVASRRMAGPADELLRLLRDSSLPEFSTAVAELRRRAEANDDELRAKADQLRQLADSDDAEARAAVLTALARSRDLSVVPLLIRALEDPSPQVVLAARNGLRFISRKFDGFGFAMGADERVRQAAIERWKAWYRAVLNDAADDASHASPAVDSK